MDEVVLQTQAWLSEQRERKRVKEDLGLRVSQTEELLRLKQEAVDVLTRASGLIGTLTDNTVRATLNKITDVINKVLAEVFPNEVKRIDIRPSLYREVHPHYNIILICGEGAEAREVPFFQEGQGVAQIVSFLLPAFLVDINKKRKFLAIDELFSGLHPNAKGIVIDLLKVLAKTFQIVLIEYGTDNIGRTYLVEKERGVASARLLT